MKAFGFGPRQSLRLGALRGRHSGARGFTLVETIAALLIFSVAIIGLLSSMGETTAAQSGMVDRARAADLAENVLEEIRYTGEVEPGTKDGEFDGANTGFSWATEIEATEVANLYVVTATITWPSGEYELSTLMRSPLAF